MKTSKSTIAKTNKVVTPAIVPASDSKLSQSTINDLLALNISENVKKSADRKTIFHKDYNNKADRTKCRTKFIKAVSLYILHLQHNKVEKANECLAEIKEIANKYYVAGDSFKNYLDYCSENMDDNKKEIIKSFVKVNAELAEIAE